MRRLLFVRPPQGSRRAPPYVALAMVAALVAIGFGVSSRPHDPAPPPAAERSPPPGNASDGGQQAPLPLNTPGPRSRWM